MATHLEFDKVINLREINAAVINVSGRQRMLSQRSALFALRLVCTQNRLEQEKLRQEMLAAIDLMENSHNSLLKGSVDMKLPNQPTQAVQAIYFEAPFYLDQQIHDYVAHVRALAQAPPTELTQENPHLQSILKASATNLLEAIEAVVSQYQQESDAAQLTMELQQAHLYQQSCAATAAAHAHARQLEQTLHDLQRTQAQLIQSDKLSSIGQMVASVAHELNNPVSFIYGNLCHASNYTENLLDLLNLYQEYYSTPIPQIQAKIQAIDLDFLLKDLPKVLSSMQVGTERLRQIVLSLRNFSRWDQTLGQAVDIHEGIDTTLLILQNRLKARHNRPAIEVVKDYGELPRIECCAGQLDQVFMNLLSNAIDALDDVPERVGRITIRTSVNTDHSGIIIHIADNGPGMTPEVKTQLFDPFFTTKPLGKGTGLGLSISHQIVVEKHGGILKCESVRGQGTAFWIQLSCLKRNGERVYSLPQLATTKRYADPSEPLR